MALTLPSSSGATSVGTHPDYWQVAEHRWRWAGIVLVTLLFTFVVEQQGVWWKRLVLYLLATIGYWHVNVAIILALRRRLPHLHQTRKRLLQQLLWAILCNAPVGFFVALGRKELELTSSPLGEAYATQLWHAAIPIVSLFVLYESVYYFNDWRRYSIQALLLEKEMAVSQLEALKQQVEPHFLFNSLNTLAALIGENEPAQEFLGALARLYRYVLLSNSATTVVLAQELEFVQAYLYLTNARLKDHIQLVQELPAAALSQHVPPLSVQMLVENAIKHNVFSATRPLRILLRLHDDYLIVRNSVHRKTVRRKSSPQTLQTVISQFALLTERPVTVARRASEFEVGLPLLPPAQSMQFIRTS